MLTSASRLFRHFLRHRSTRVTTEGTRFLLFTLAVAVAAINTGNNLFYLLLSMMLSIILMSGIMAEYCLRRLAFHRHLPDLVYVGEPVTATVVVANRKSRLPSFSLHLWDVAGEQDFDRGLTVRQLMPGASQILSYPLIATRRGRLCFDGVRVGTSFPFGLFHKKAYYPLAGSVVVAPVIQPVESALFQGVALFGQDFSLPRKGHGSDLYNLRQYQAGDDSRASHWLSTARTSKLMVRETEAEDQRRVTLLLSLLAPLSHERLFEEAVSLTASMAQDLGARGYQVRLVIGGMSSPFGQGEAHFLQLMESLALCERWSPDGPEDRVFSEDVSYDPEGGSTILFVPWGEPRKLFRGVHPDGLVTESMLQGRLDAI
ncbi:MAG: DUF58 domain-containing protein [Nitrospira sp.]|nr:DUF58 domain-containing protein [Nitrospira sp.]